MGVDVDEADDQHVRRGHLPDHPVDDRLDRRAVRVAEVDDLVERVAVLHEEVGDQALERAEGDEAHEVEVLHGDLGELDGAPFAVGAVVEDADRRGLAVSCTGRASPSPPTIDSRSLTANRFAQVTRLPRIFSSFIRSTPGSGSAAHMPSIATSRGMPSELGDRQGDATFSLKAM